MSKIKMEAPQPQGDQESRKGNATAGCVTAVGGIIALAIICYSLYILFTV